MIDKSCEEEFDFNIAELNSIISRLVDLKVKVFVLEKNNCELQEKLNRLTPQLPDDIRERSREIWEFALHQHMHGNENEPGPATIIAEQLVKFEYDIKEKILSDIHFFLKGKYQNGC